MKTITTLLLMVAFATGTNRTNAQSSGAAPAAVPAAEASVPPSAVASVMVSPPSTNAPFVPVASGANTNELRLNFRGVPLNMVLNYLSDAAGFIIVMDTQVSGRVDVWSDQPVTTDEAVNLLNSVLNKNGYAAIRNGRTLTIMSKMDAKTHDIPVKIGNDPNLIPNNDEMITQIIPIRYVDAKQLMTDLSPFVSAQATIVANEAGNSIVVTDTQSNIRHLMEIIEAIDNSAQGETEIRVFPLKYANPADVATELGQIFQNNSTGNGQTQAPIRFGGGGPGGFFARMAAAQAAAGNNQNSAVQKNSQVVAVADARTQSVIVSASKDLMDQIAGMMEQLDVPSQRDQGVYVFQMKNGDPEQAVQVLQDMFQSSSSERGSTATTTTQSPLQQRAQTSATTMGTSTTTSSGVGGTGIGNGAGTGARQF